MFRRFLVLLVIFSMFVSGVTVLAMEHDNSWVENGNTYVGVFHVKDMPAADLELWKSFMTAPRLFAEEDNNRKIYIMDIPEGVSGKIIKNPSGSSFAYNVQFSPAFNCKCLVFQYSSSTGMYEPAGHYDQDSFRGFGLDAIIVNRGFSLTSSVPSSELYIQHPGDLYIVDDLGGQMEGDGEVDSGEAGDGAPWWQKLKELFVPSEGYFSNWFEEIKDAAMEKMGPIKSIVDAFSDLFEKLQHDNTETSIWIDVPEGQYYPGSPGIKVDVLHFGVDLIGIVRNWLTAVVVVFTAICCYKRIVVLFEQ